MKRAALLAVVLCGCGVDQSSSSTVSKTSQALHCDSEPTLNTNGTATKLSCPFEQQLANIKTNGSSLSAGLHSQGQPVAVSASMQCGDWVMGTDANGVQVFVSTLDGTVRSHGAVHAGFATSVLPTQLQLPISLQP